MANLELLVTLLRAVGPETHVVLVGDADQLAPVGAGKPFAELVASELVPTTRLTHIFRQAAGSMIVQGAHAIRRGERAEFAPSRGDAAGPVPDRARRPGRRARGDRLARVASGCPRTTRRPGRDIQVFAPVYRGELGIDALNDALRDGAQPRRAAGPRRPAANRRQADDDRAQPARAGADERHAAAAARRGRRARATPTTTSPAPAACWPRRDDGAVFRLPPERGRTACGSPTPARSTAARGSSCRWR